MPRLSDSMEEGTIVSWLREDGEEVNAGDELVEIETDKATMTYEAPGTGALRIVTPAGTTVGVGELIAVLGAPAALDSGTPSPAELRPAQPALTAVATASAGTTSLRQDAPAPDRTAPTGQEKPARGVRITPLARRFAESHGIDWHSVTGTGPAGRVTMADVRTVVPPGSPPPAQDSSPTTPAGPSLPASGDQGHERDAELPSPSLAKGAQTDVELTRVQLVVARRMAEAKATIPHFQVQVEVAMDRALELRAQIKAAAQSEDTPSINDVIVKATALALRDFPRVNGSFRDGSFHLHSRINVGVAVASADALVVPTVFDADMKSLGAIRRDIRRLASRVRDQTITPPELAGATFTVSNLGMYGVSAITPVINPPQAAILGVGATRTILGRSPDGEVVDAQIMTLTLSADHRILYGAEAAQFLSRIRALIETPLTVAL